MAIFADLWQVVKSLYIDDLKKKWTQKEKTVWTKLKFNTGGIVYKISKK